MYFEDLKPKNHKYEKEFRSKVYKHLKKQQCDVFNFQRCGKGLPDFLVFSYRQKIPFFIELKGEQTGYSDTKQAAQEEFARKYRERGYLVLRLGAHVTSWKCLLSELCRVGTTVKLSLPMQEVMRECI